MPCPAPARLETPGALLCGKPQPATPRHTLSRELRVLGFCPCTGGFCAFCTPSSSTDHKCKLKFSPQNEAQPGLWLRCAPSPADQRQLLGTGHSMSYVFPTETFAFTNWVSEQRLKHLTSVDSDTPPPAPAAAASLFLWVSALRSVLSEGSRGATASPWELGVGRLGFQATKASRLSRPVTD